MRRFGRYWAFWALLWLLAACGAGGGGAGGGDCQPATFDGGCAFDQGATFN